METIGFNGHHSLRTTSDADAPAMNQLVHSPLLVTSQVTHKKSSPDYQKTKNISEKKMNKGIYRPGRSVRPKNLVQYFGLYRNLVSCFFLTDRSSEKSMTKTLVNL